MSLGKSTPTEIGVVVQLVVHHSLRRLDGKGPLTEEIKDEDPH